MRGEPDINEAMTTEIKIQVSEKELQRLLDWVSRLDNKFVLVLGIDTGMLGVVASLFPRPDLWTWPMIVVAACSALLLAVCFGFAAYGIYPQTKGPSQSLIYFASIARKSFKEYKRDFSKQTSEEYLDDLLEQCHQNAKITDSKFSRLKWAYRMIFIALAPWVATIYLFKSVHTP